jgi:hypothetical protein
LAALLLLAWLLLAWLVLATLLAALIGIAHDRSCARLPRTSGNGHSPGKFPGHAIPRADHAPGTGGVPACALAPLVSRYSAS